MSEKKLILVTNDDGIASPGIRALVDVVRQLGDVVVIAPDKPQSGMGHAITINSTLRIDKANFYDVLQEYTCTGTPVDCVKIAVNKILKRKPDLCVSGINHGPNFSINVIYSGTMSAAVEGAIESIPSIGFSLLSYNINADFSASQRIAKIIIENVLTNGLDRGTCLNVNIPAVHLDEMAGIKICRQARANWIEELDERIDPSGRPYYWLTGRFENYEEGNTETDAWALQNNFVSVVPVQFDMTAHQSIPSLKKWNFNIRQDEKI